MDAIVGSRKTTASSCADSHNSEAWRYTGPFTRFNRFKGAFPGLGIATVAFAGYCVFEWAFLSKDHGHNDGHGDAHLRTGGV